MYAMEPVWRFLNNLEGFEAAAFWIATVTGVGLIGFFLDYVMQRQGFGAIFNSLYVALGIFLGLYVRFNYLSPNKVHLGLYDPILSISAIGGVIVVMLIVMAFVRNVVSW